MLRPIRTLAIIPLLAAAPLACSNSVAADPSAARVSGAAPIRTDRTEYVADRSGGGVSLDIPLRFTNPTGGPVFVTTCHGAQPPVLEKLVGDSWEKAFNEPILLCLGAPIVIPAGGNYDYTFRVRAAPPGTNTYPQFEQPSVPGVYRLVWAVYEGDGSDLARESTPRLLPVDQRVSNTFRITE